MRTSQRNAFTLIELLVVISIIAILAGIALPVFGEVQVRGAQTKALSNAKQIGLACRLYSLDFDGRFPQYTDIVNKSGTPSDANEALEVLIPDYIPDKNIFSIPKSAYTKNAGSASARSQPTKLAPAENQFAYVLGLSDTSNALYPLIADGFDTGGITYTTEEGEPGGVWKGKKAVVIRVDTSGAVGKGVVRRKTSYVPRNDVPKKNLFETAEDWLGTSAKVLQAVP